MPEATSTIPRSPARKVAEILQRFPRHGERKSGHALSPSLVKEVKSLALEARDYLQYRIASVEKLSGASVGQNRLEKIEGEIEALNEKDNKSEADYSRLMLLERQAYDLQAKCDEASANQEEADDLLKNELRALLPSLSSVLSNVESDRLIMEAAQLIRPWCLEADPFEVARSLPKVSDAARPFTNIFNINRSGLENATAALRMLKTFL